MGLSCPITGLLLIFTACGCRGFELSIKKKSEGFCLTSPSACLVQEDQNLVGSYNNTNIMGCSERCSENDHCEHWTWWEKLEFCQLFDNCQNQVSNNHCQTGDRSCGVWKDYLSVVTGGLNNVTASTKSSPNQNRVYLVGQDKLCDVEIEMPRARWGHTSSFINSKLYLCGGTTDLAGYMAPNKTCDSFTVFGDNIKWFDMAPMKENRHSAAGLTMFGQMYVIGGHNGVEVTSSVEIYNPSTNTWGKGPSMPVARSGHCAVRYKDSIIVTGGVGIDGTTSNRAFVFNVTSNRWMETSKMIQPRAYHGCSLNTRSAEKDSKKIYEVIVTGGTYEDKILTTTEYLDISTHKWIPFTELPFSLAGHGQIDLGEPRILGGQGELAGIIAEGSLILHYSKVEWYIAQFSLPVQLEFHSVARYPKELVKC